jgi:hypothetical protein
MGIPSSLLVIATRICKKYRKVIRPLQVLEGFFSGMRVATSIKKEITFMVNSTISNQDKKLSQHYPTEVPNEIVEEQTKKIPNLLFLGLAGASIGVSAYLTFAQKRETLGNFVGLWVPTIMLLGIYNKLVKIEDEVLEENSMAA